MVTVDERQTRSQWRRLCVCVDQSGRKKRVGYWTIGKRRDAAAGACWKLGTLWLRLWLVLRCFGDQQSASFFLVVRRLPGCSQTPCRACEVRVACVSRGAMSLEDPNMMIMMNDASNRTCF